MSDLKPYESFAVRQGYKPGELVPQDHSINQLALDGTYQRLLNATTEDKPVTIEGKSLFHVVNILLPSMIKRARAIGMEF